MTDQVYDFIAIGVGPFNLGLAALTSNIEEINGLFLDKNPGFDWHPGMMLESATLQTPFLSDLVTLADPTHPLSFLNYAKKKGHLYSFYIRESFFLMRKEYNQYCQWAIKQMDNILFNTEVTHIQYCEGKDCYLVESICKLTQIKKFYTCKKLVLGTGPSPHIPESCRSLSKSDAIHSAKYLNHKQAVQASDRISIVGSGQSAAEIFYDLLQDIDQFGYELNWITRSSRYFPLEYSKLTLEMTSPEYVDYFYQLPADKRDNLINKQKHLYKGINASLINDIYDLLYVKKLSGEVKVNLLTNSELIHSEQLEPTLDSSGQPSLASLSSALRSYELSVNETCSSVPSSSVPSSSIPTPAISTSAISDQNIDASPSGIRLDFLQHEQNTPFSLETDKLILSTGYQYLPPSFLAEIDHRIQWDENGRFDVNRNYTIDRNQNSIFVQNAELHTHGFVTPDLGMACYRNSYIIRELLGYEYYPVESAIAFQQFDMTTSGQTPNNLTKDASK